jgi:YD repeat-containing protein
MIEKHRKLLADARAVGGADSSESVLGESLALISYNWLAQNWLVQQLSSRITKLTTQYHHGVGIAGQAAIQQSGIQGPYVDLPLNFITSQPYTYSSSLTASQVGAFFAQSGVSSSLESAVLEQTQALVAGMQAASTIRLVDLNAATGEKTYFADGTSNGGCKAYYSSIRPNLTGTYSASDIAFIDASVSNNGSTCSGTPTGKQVLLPKNGSISVGAWQGAGYTVTTQTSTSMSSLQKISGGLSGGFSGTNVSIPALVQSTGTQLLPPTGTPSVPPVILAQAPTPSSPTIAEPIAAITGAYLYAHTDLSIGSGSFPYALPFSRNYSSAANSTDVGMGNGWTSNYHISASRSSDPFSGLGQTSPAAAAAAIVAMYISQDLLGGTRDAQRLTIAWLISDWLTDQLTNNSVTINWPDTNESFTLLPRPEGATAGAFVAPLGSAVVVTGSTPDTYGNLTTFTYRTKDQSVLAFNPVDADGKGTLAGWALPNGMSVSLAYDYSYGGKNYLSGVSNNLGRALSLAYDGARIASVSDSTGRSASFGYDASGNLVRYSDPMGYVTTYAYDDASRMVQLFYPSNPTIPFFTNAYDELGRVSLQADSRGNVWSFYFAGARSETLDADGNRHVTYQTPRAKVLKDAWVLDSGFGEVFNDTAQQNDVVNVAKNQYDGQDRLTLATAPEGGTVAYTYSQDFNHNVVQLTRSPKPGSPLSSLVTRTDYDATYNAPTRIVDPMGAVTEMAYDRSTGNLVSVTADTGGASHFNARSSFTYTNKGQLLSATDPLGTVTLNAYDGSGNLVQVTRDYGRLNQVSAMSYDARGDAVALTDPAATSPATPSMRTGGS